jgi:hypothetical protein
VKQVGIIGKKENSAWAFECCVTDWVIFKDKVTITVLNIGQKNAARER